MTNAYANDNGEDFANPYMPRLFGVVEIFISELSLSLILLLL